MNDNNRPKEYLKVFILILSKNYCLLIEADLFCLTLLWSLLFSSSLKETFIARSVLILL